MIANPEVADTFRKRAKVRFFFFSFNLLYNIMLSFLGGYIVTHVEVLNLACFQ